MRIKSGPKVDSTRRFGRIFSNEPGEALRKLVALPEKGGATPGVSPNPAHRHAKVDEKEYEKFEMEEAARGKAGVNAGVTAEKTKRDERDFAQRVVEQPMKEGALRAQEGACAAPSAEAHEIAKQKTEKSMKNQVGVGKAESKKVEQLASEPASGITEEEFLRSNQIELNDAEEPANAVSDDAVDEPLPEDEAGGEKTEEKAEEPEEKEKEEEDEDEEKEEEQGKSEEEETEHDEEDQEEEEAQEEDDEVDEDQEEQEDVEEAGNQEKDEQEDTGMK